MNATTNSKPAPTTGLCTCGHPAAEHNEDGCMHPHDDGSFRFCPCKAGVAVVGARVAWETNGGEPRRGTIDQLGCSYGCAIAYGALESGERFVVQIARLARAS